MSHKSHIASAGAGLASSLIALVLCAGVAEAGKGGFSQPAAHASGPATIERKVEQKSDAKFRSEAKSEMRAAKRQDDPKPKSDPRVTTKVEDLKPANPKTANGTTSSEPRHPLMKVASLPASNQVKSSTAKAVVAGTVAGASLAALRSSHEHAMPKAPQEDKNHHVSQTQMDHFVAQHVLHRDATIITKADAPAKYHAAVERATTLIKDPSKGYQVAKYGEVKKAGDQPKGEGGTIVINENNKTVYVPASSVSGSDHRTIVVNCNNCKVVIVGENGKNVVDDRKIVVNGSNDKVVVQSDKSNGGAGQSGGTVTDNRQVVVNGSGDKIKLQGDNANGGNGHNGGQQGQNGGNGGYVDDNRQVTVNGSGTKVDLGKDQANGGNGGKGSDRGGNGGNGGRVDDDRTVVSNGNGTRIANAGADANGGRGGNGGMTGGDGGNGGRTHGKGTVIDNGSGTTSTPGTYNTNGGDGGIGGRSN